MAVQDIFVRFRSNAREFAKELLQPQNQFTKLKNKSGELNQRFGKVGKSGAKFGRQLRHMTTGFKGFRMEMLSVMFFGMGLQRFFKGLITPALQMVGVFDIFSTALAILFLPLAMKVLEWAMLFMDWVLTMGPDLQILINWIAGLGYILGTLLAVFGTIVLGIGGVIMVFGGVILAIISAIASILGLITNWKVLIAVLLGIGLASKTVDAFGGAVGRATGFVGSLLDRLIQLDFVQGVLDRLGISGETFGEVWTNLVDKIKAKFIEVPETIRSKVKWMWDFLTIIFKQWKARLDELIDKFMEMGGDDALSGIKELAKSLELLIPSLDTIAATLNKINFLFDKLGSKGLAGNIYAQLTGTQLNQDTGKFDKLGGRQTGGYIPHTGLYKLHAGENVSQAGASTFSPNIVVNASSNVDIEQLKSQLSSEWSDELSRLSRR